MKRIDFQALLTDLFNLYNPSKLNDVNGLIEKYTGQELDAIQMVYIKYNFKSHPHYNPNVTEEFLQDLIDKYNKKERVLSKENVERKQADQIKTISENKEIENKKFSEELEVRFRQLEEKLNTFQDFDITISNYYTNSEVELPDSKLFLIMGAGSKFICRNKEGKIISLFVEDITLDFVSNKEKPTIEIILNESKMS